jgi:hypothetical protein
MVLSIHQAEGFTTEATESTEVYIEPSVLSVASVVKW